LGVKVDAESRSEESKQARLFSNGFVVWIDFAGDRRLERTPVEDVRQATTKRALGSTNHVFVHHIKTRPRRQPGRAPEGGAQAKPASKD